jgi:NAD(P)-dependent dehydrogenase (short-subunit alcohol dehydrogenase family)
VVIHSHRSGRQAQELRRALQAKGALAEVLVADLADTGRLGPLVERAASLLGPVGLLVNNASAFAPDDVHSLDAALWERHFAVNLQAPVFLAHHFARQSPQGGAIVNVIDQRVWKPTPHFLSYTLSKSALFTATRTLAQALAPRIRVNAVGPGPTLASARQSREDFLRQGASVLLGRGPRPNEIARAVAFLASAESVTGQMLAVDGGQHLAWETPDVVAAE